MVIDCVLIKNNSPRIIKMCQKIPSRHLAKFAHLYRTQTNLGSTPSYHPIHSLNNLVQHPKAMTSIVPFQATDLFDLNPINLDPLTENFYIYFYLQYLSDWPTLFYKSTSALDEPTGYILAKTEGQVLKKEWHAHISAVTIDPNYRRIGLGSYLCQMLETYTQDEKPYYAFFIDLFVKCNNTLAINFYEKLGYSVFRRVVGYYGPPGRIPSKNRLNDEIDAFDMRKSLKRDKAHECVRKAGRRHHVLPQDVVF